MLILIREGQRSNFGYEDVETAPITRTPTLVTRRGGISERSYFIPTHGNSEEFSLTLFLFRRTKAKMRFTGQFSSFSHVF